MPLLNLLPEAALELDSSGHVIATNDLATQMLDADGAALVGASLRELVLSGALDCAAGAGAAPVVRRELVARRANGVPFPLDVSVRRHDGRIVAVLRDRNVDDLASLAQRHFDAAFDLSPIGMALFSSDGEYVRVNGSLCEILGRSEDELIGRRDQELTHPDDRAPDVEAAWRILNGEIDTWQTEKRFVRPDGEIVWTIANLVFLRDDHGRPISWLGQFQDITALRHARELQRHLADHDDLTDIYNRRRFRAEVSRELARSARYGTRATLLEIDLDSFKSINDGHGHATGDTVLCAVASVIRRALRESDFCGRLGGDEFAALLVEADAADGEAVARRIVEGIHAMVPAELGIDRHITASVGIVAFGPSAPPAYEVLCAQADGAMYAAKRAGGNGWASASPSPAGARATA